MEIKARFEVVYYVEVLQFLEELDFKTRSKILYNIDKARYSLDNNLFKKLTGTDVWEFRTLYNGKQYRILSFWDTETTTLVVAAHCFIKKTGKTPQKEIERTQDIMKQYFKQK
ncbi:MAG: type II toxin-antitoxin system RelE/ParE family toxin [Culturomica sp.]|jgi:phage-related protein|nr:type II toxin-antitoxin system RelE/ParE family toxin [Culturomica sp.]